MLHILKMNLKHELGLRSVNSSMEILPFLLVSIFSNILKIKVKQT